VRAHTGNGGGSGDNPEGLAGGRCRRRPEVGAGGGRRQGQAVGGDGGVAGREKKMKFSRWRGFCINGRNL
jgi:hypothetical protein